MSRSLSAHFMRFALFGVIGTAGHFALLVLLVESFGVTPVTASVAGAVFGALINYVLNHRFNYRSTRSHGHTAPRFFTIVVIGFGLNALLMLLLSGPPLSMFYVAAQVVSTVCVLLWNFAANHFWTFGKPLR